MSIPRTTLEADPAKAAMAEWAILSDYIFAEIGLSLYLQEKPRVFAVYLGGSTSSAIFIISRGIARK